MPGWRNIADDVLPVPTSGALAVDKGDGGPGTIRRFVDSGVQNAVDRAMANLAKEGKSTAFLAVANRNKVGAAVMARIGKQWSVMVVAEKEWKGDYKLEAAVKWSV